MRTDTPSPKTDSGAGPWDLSALERTPPFEIGRSHHVQEGDRRVILSEIYYAGENWMGRPTRVFAHNARPGDSLQHPVPAMVLVHGGGGTASAEWARLWASRGYAALSMDLYGQGPEGKRLPDGGPDWSDLSVAFRLTAGLKNGWIWQAVASVIRGVSAVRSFPEVDENRVGITGISWGGSLTCIVMSLDSRLQLAVPVYGFGFNPMMGIHADASEPERELVRANFEPALYLHRCRVPVLWVSGTNEPYATLDRLQQSYSAASGPRTLSVTVRPSHIDPQMADRGWERQEIHHLTDSLFRAADGLATVTRVEVTGDTVRVGYSSPVRIENAAIHWTAELEKDWPARRWQSAFAELVESEKVVATLPQARPIVLFLTLMDRRGAVISTEPVPLQTSG